MNIPLSLTAGDRWTWTDALSDYPATLWTLTYYFRGPTSLAAAVGTASGTDHVLVVAAATTASLKPGSYAWQAQAVLIATTTTKQTVATGRLKVEPNLSDATAEYRLFDEIIRDDLAIALATRAQAPDRLSYSIAGRSQTFSSWEEIEQAYARACYKVDVQNGNAPSRSFIRFEQA